MMEKRVSKRFIEAGLPVTQANYRVYTLSYAICFVYLILWMYFMLFNTDVKIWMHYVIALLGPLVSGGLYLATKRRLPAFALAQQEILFLTTGMLPLALLAIAAMLSH